MQDSSEQSLREVFRALATARADLSKTLEYQIFSIISNGIISIDELKTKIDFNKIMNDTLYLLESAELITLQDDKVLPTGLGTNKVDTASIPGLKAKLESALRSDSSSEQVKEDEPPEVSPSIQSGQTKKVQPPDQDQAKQAEPVPQTRKTRAKSVETPIPDFKGNADRRKRLRQEAFNQTETESTTTKDDDIDSLFDDALGESIEDFVSDFADLEIEDTKAASGLIEPLADLLIEYDYIPDQQAAENSAEYQVMQLILENYPIRTEDIESRLENIDSLSLMLSNLKADDLITQTNDYRYTISKKTYKVLKDFTSGGSQEESIDEDMAILKKFVTKPQEQLINACLHLNYIDKPGRNFTQYQVKSPEVEVLYIILEQQPIESEKIKQLVDNALPVVVSRMCSKLHADGIIKTNNNNQYLPTTKLYYYMVMDRLEKELDEDLVEELKAKYL